MGYGFFLVWDGMGWDCAMRNFNVGVENNFFFCRFVPPLPESRERGKRVPTGEGRRKYILRYHYFPYRVIDTVEIQGKHITSVVNCCF